MPIIYVPLKDILTSPDDPVDLALLPPEEAIEYVRRTYAFLPKEARITLSEGIVTITIPDETAQRVNEAIGKHQRAIRLAEQGRYRSAIPLFRQVLEIVPDHLDARRNLAMAYMEVGDNEAAKRHLLHVLQLHPQDTHAYLIVGNIYAQVENDLGAAERFYEAAYRLSPQDAYVLNSFGALLGKRGHFERACELFEQAIEYEPDYPNPRYGLALVYAERGDAKSAISVLEELFARPKSKDSRRDPVYDQARGLYLNACREVAQAENAKMMAHLEQAIDHFAEEAGYPIHVVKDDSLDVPANTQLAWVYGRAYHTIKYKSADPAILPHLIAHEFEHIRLAYEALEAGRGKLFSTTDRTRDIALRFVTSSVSKLQRMGLDRRVIDDYVERIISGLANQLYNIPLDMFIEHRVYHNEPFLRPSQLVSLDATHSEALRALTDPSVREMSPTRVFQASTAMNCAFALFTDSLFGGATAYAGPYADSRMLSTGRRLFRAWKRALSRLKPGDEYDLVDEFAKILRLQGWYEWKSEQADIASVPTDTELEGVTNPDLLKEKTSAAVMYCLDALKRFENMLDSQVIQIATEIAMLGRSGLDYASSERKYTLRSLPGERFSGLQLMCLMHVGFKRADPTMDPGTGLDDAYRQALDLYRLGGR